MIELFRPKESGERLTLNALCVVRKAISKLLVKFISLGNTLGEDLVKVRSARVIARTACVSGRSNAGTTLNWSLIKN